jgi:hypothetical protein
MRALGGGIRGLCAAFATSFCSLNVRLRARNNNVFHRDNGRAYHLPCTRNTAAAYTRARTSIVRRLIYTERSAGRTVCRTNRCNITWYICAPFRVVLPFGSRGANRRPNSVFGFRYADACSRPGKTRLRQRRYLYKLYTIPHDFT